MARSSALGMYRALAFLAHRAPHPTAKLAASIAGRRAAAARWIAWAAAHRPRALVWMHGASVGELVTAIPVAHRLRRRVPGLEVVFTHSSPSACGWTFDGVARVDYLPLDEPAPVRLTLAALAPRLLGFSGGDVWPELAAQARASGIPVAVFGARARTRSLRATPLGHLFYDSIYRALDWVGARSEPEAARWVLAGAPADRVTITGDPRHDYVVERSSNASAIAPLRRWAAGRAVLVAGSTHPTDERALVAAASVALDSRADTGLVIVPHVPTEPRIREVAARCTRAGHVAATWREGDPAPDTRIVVVGQTGILHDLYAVASVAYVGGGFRRGRVHAVAEPAAWAVPVIVGPRAGDDRDVELIVGAGGGAVLPGSRVAVGLAHRWLAWSNPATGRAAGSRARSALDVGAADRSVTALEHLLQV